MLCIAKIESRAKGLLPRALWTALAIVASIVGAGAVLYVVWAIVLMIDGPLTD
jgi:hypothetical protein